MINELSLIRLEYNKYNGFIFEILNVEIGGFEGALLGLSFGGLRSFLYLHLLFFTIKISSPLS